MKNILSVVAVTLGLIVIVDIFGFMAWIASGQTPADGFYIGALTASVLRALLF